MEIDGSFVPLIIFFFVNYRWANLIYVLERLHTHTKALVFVVCGRKKIITRIHEQNQ